jgi:hypothetical protein
MCQENYHIFLTDSIRYRLTRREANSYNIRSSSRIGPRSRTHWPAGCASHAGPDDLRSPETVRVSLRGPGVESHAERGRGEEYLIGRREARESMRRLTATQRCADQSRGPGANLRTVIAVDVRCPLSSPRRGFDSPGGDSMACGRWRSGELWRGLRPVNGRYQLSSTRHAGPIEMR